MTLSRQLISIISVLFLLLFAASFITSVNNSRNFLQPQLLSHAQDTATSLGVSLREHMPERDIASMETLINSIFDRGYYRHLLLTDMSGVTLVERQLAVKINGVPDWFVAFFPLETPQAETLITSGWSQSGHLTLSSHPGYAYQQLWSNAKDTLLWTALAFMLALAAIYAFVRITFRPLYALERQAEAICRSEFPIIEPLPRTRELRRVVVAMNKMTSRLKRMLEELTLQLESFRQRAYTDRLTQLPNRSGFEARLQALLKDSESAPQGVLWLIRLRDIARYNQQHGLDAGDALITLAVQQLQQHQQGLDQALCARLSGADFVLLAPGLATASLAQDTEQLSQRLQILNSLAGQFNVAGLQYDKQQALAELLSRADLALSKAVSAGPNAHYTEASPVASQILPINGSQQWRQLLVNALEARSPYLLAQPVEWFGDSDRTNTGEQRSPEDLSCPDTPPNPLFSELLVRIPQGDQPALVAGAFIPMAERLQLAPQLDRLVVEKALAHLRSTVSASNNNDSTLSVSVNLCCASLLDPAFCQWLNTQLEQAPALSRRLVFEILEQSAIQSLENTRQFVAGVQALGARVALEHFGLHSLGFHQLRCLKTDYLKIDGSFSQGIATHEDHQFFIRTLCKLGHGLGMLIIAEQVETQEDLACLQSLGVNAAQGYYLGRPEAI
ncbi:MAG: EAL domain-containing protein [Motiliproteus sp.]